MHFVNEKTNLFQIVAESHIESMVAVRFYHTALLKQTELERKRCLRQGHYLRSQTMPESNETKISFVKRAFLYKKQECWFTSYCDPTLSGAFMFWFGGFSSSLFTRRSLIKLSRSISSSLICFSASAKVANSSTYFIWMFIVNWKQKQHFMKYIDI